MKNNKKFILAAGAAALGLVAATGVTSGFAWFAVNSTVTVNNLNLKAQADNSYLLIGDGANMSATELQNGNKKTIDLQVPQVSTQPVHYMTETYTITEAGKSTNWGTAVAETVDASTKKDDTQITALAADATLSNYVLMHEFTVGLAKNSSSVSAIEVSSVTLPKNTGISLILATTAGGFLFENKDVAESEAGTITFNSGLKQFTSSGLEDDSKTLAVKAFVFVDGEDSNVYLKNAAALTGAVSFTLKTSTGA